MQKLGIAILALIVLAATPVRGEDAFNRRSAYVGGGGSYALSAFQGDLLDLGFDDALGWNVRFGYRFNEFFALEGIHEYLVDFSKEFEPGTNVDVSVADISAGPKLILPMGRFQPYLMGGFGWLYADSNDKAKKAGVKSQTNGMGVAGRLTAGLDLFATEAWSIYLDGTYVVPAVENQDLQHFSVGWGFKYHWSF